MNYHDIKSWENKTIFVDIDETICITPSSRNYEKAKPIVKNINIINDLSLKNQIVYWTARGTGSGINWAEITLKQFQKWNVCYDKLEFKKPIYDIFIDDKNIESKVFFDEN